MSVEVSNKIKVLITGYSAEGHTSFGSQIREVWKRLIRTGKYEIVQHGWFHTAHIEQVPWQIMPTNTTWDDTGRQTLMLEDKWGQRSFPRICSQVKPNLVWTLADIYMVEHLGHFRHTLGYKYIQYMPVDGVPSPKKYRDTLLNADMSVAPAEFGSDAMENLTGHPHPFIWHGVDTDVYYPYPKERINEIRKAAIGANIDDDAYIIGWVGKDQTRKQPWNLFEILYYLRSGNYIVCTKCLRVTRMYYDKMTGKAGKAPKECRHCYSNKVKKARPINAYLWCHAYNQPQQAWDFDLLITTWGMKDKVIFTTGLSRDTGLTTAEIVDLFNCFDVFVSLSGGEGFGIPLIEAQSCGVPVLYSDYSAQKEICTDGGKPVDVAAFVPEPITHIDRAVPCIDSAIKELRDLYLDPIMRKKLGIKGRAKMVDSFSHDNLCMQWDDLITKVMEAKASVMGVRS